MPVDAPPSPALSPAERAHAQWLASHRPELSPGYADAIPAARAAVLARLWGALVREPLPGRGSVTALPGGYLAVQVAGRAVGGPADAARPFATVEAGLRVGAGYDHPATLAAALWPDHPAFACELDSSVANLALARAGTAPRAPGGDDLAAAEQSIVDGHPLHPGCRTRTPMDTADLLAYAPEHAPTVELPVLAVPPHRWHSTGTGLPPRLVVHPWQWRRMRDAFPDLVPTGTTVRARPLMSLRTLATADRHLKTAVDVQMTSAVRTVSAAALHNGPVLSTFLDGLTRRIPRFGVLGEPAGGAVLVDGAPCRSLAVLYRTAPRLAAGERVAPLATLTAGRPAATDLVRAGYGGDPAAFLTDVAGLLLPPLLTLLDLGVALEAHGQNVLLVTAGGRARRLLYRDLGGVRVSPKRLAGHGLEAPPLVGDLTSDDPDVLRTKLLAAVVATVLAELVSYLAARYGTEPDPLWRAVAAAVPAGTPRAGALFDSATLPLKAMTAMRLADTTEDRWCTVANPLAGLAPGQAA